MEKMCGKLKDTGYNVYFENDSIKIPGKKMTVFCNGDFFCAEFIFENQKFQYCIGNDYNMLYNFLVDVLSEKITFTRISETGIRMNNWQERRTKQETGKILSLIRRILNIITGAGLTIFSLEFLITGLLYYIDYTSLNWLADSSPVPTAVAGIIIGVSMIHHGITKKPLAFGGTVLYGLGVVLTSFGMSLLFCLCSEFNKMPKADFFGSSGVFIMFMALGIFFVISGLRYGTAYNPEKRCNVRFLHRIPVLPPDDDIKRLVEAVKKKSEKEAFLINENTENKDISLFDSKAGGLPYWDFSKPYPVDSEGTKMRFIIQFNLSQLPENNIFPPSGLIQVFLSDTYVDYDECRIVFHKDIDYSVTETDIEMLDIPSNPVYSICFEKTMIPVTFYDNNATFVLHETAEELGIELEKTIAFYEIADSREFDRLPEKSFLLGNPEFIDYDVRNVYLEENRYNTLFLQIGENDALYCCMNCNVYWFFISGEDLNAMNFDDVFCEYDSF